MLQQSLTDVLRSLVEEGRLRPARLVSLEQAHWKDWISRRLARRDPVFANAAAHEDPEAGVDFFQRLFQEPLPSAVVERARSAVAELVREMPAAPAPSGELRALLRLALVVQAREVRPALRSWLSAATDLAPDVAAALLIAFGNLSGASDQDDAPIFRRWFENDTHAAHAFVGLARTGSWRPDDIVRLLRLAQDAARAGRNFALTPALCALFRALPLGVARNGLWAALEHGSAFGDREATWTEIARRVAHFGYSLPDAESMFALAPRADPPVTCPVPPARRATAWQAPIYAPA